MALAAVTAVCLWSPGVAGAATTKVGSLNLPAGGSLQICGATGPVCTVMQGNVDPASAGNYVARVPVDGTLVSWSYRSANGFTGDSFSLRVLRPTDSAETSFKAIATSTAPALPDGDDQVRGPFSVSIPVSAGDRIALRGNGPGDYGVPVYQTSPSTTDEVRYFSPDIADGSTVTPLSAGNVGQQVLVQATIEYSEGGGAGGSAPLPTAVFKSAGSPTLKRATWLSGKDSTVAQGLTVKRYHWTIDQGRSYDFDCGGGTSAVSVAFKKAGTHTVTLAVTDSLGRTSAETQAIKVPTRLVNRANKKVFTCEEPLGSNQPDQPGCVKTFSFGDIVEVNGRGGPDQCFHIESRSLLSSQVPHIRASSSIGPVGRPLSDYRVYHASIKGPIALNGLPLPVPNSVQTEYDSWEATVSIGRVPIVLGIAERLLKTKEIPLELKVLPDKHGRFDLPPMQLLKLGKVFGLDLGGGADFTLLKGRKSEIKLSMSLPVFKVASGGKAEANLTLQASNQGGIELEGARLAHIPSVFLGPLYVQDLYFNYARARKIWEGGARVSLLQGGFGINAVPPPPDYGFGLRDGRWDHAGFGADFPFPPSRPDLFPPFQVHLREVGAAIGIKPLRITGRLGIDLAYLLDIDGTAFVGLASPTQPYDFPDEFAPPGLEFLAGRYLDSLSIAIGGDASLHVPVLGKLPLVNGYLFYAYPDYAEFGGGFKFDVADRFSVDGDVGGFAAFGKGKFNLEGNLRACADIEITKFCLGAGVVVSSKGIGFCTVVPVPVSPFGPTLPVPAGIGYRWGGGPDIMVFSCDTGPYKEARPSSARTAAARSFTVERGLPSMMVKVVGRDAPPAVELTGPGGQRILAPQDDRALVRKDVVVIPQTPEKTTLIAIKAPAAGRWTIQPRAGSSPITSVARANGLREPSVHASVRGRGLRRVLAYRLRRDAGQRVTFLEKGARTYRQLGLARGSRGKIRFTPADGRRGRRAIIAQVERGGVLVKNLVVAHYSAPAPPRPAKPRGVRVRRTSKGLLVSWRRARGAFSYAVLVRQSNGIQYSQVTRKRTLLFPDVNRLGGGSAYVTGMRRDNVGGRTARAKFKAPHKTRKPHHKRRRQR